MSWLLLSLVLALVLVAVLPAAAGPPAGRGERYGLVIGIDPAHIDTYRELHRATWPGVLAQIDRSHIRNYSIFLAELEPGKHYLFAYFEYTGEDFAADMAAMGEDAETRRWWKETDPCQLPCPTRREGEFWLRAEEVFHHRGGGG